MAILLHFFVSSVGRSFGRGTFAEPHRLQELILISMSKTSVCFSRLREQIHKLRYFIVQTNKQSDLTRSFNQTLKPQSYSEQTRECLELPEVLRDVCRRFGHQLNIQKMMRDAVGCWFTLQQDPAVANTLFCSNMFLFFWGVTLGGVPQIFVKYVNAVRKYVLTFQFLKSLCDHHKCFASEASLSNA